jgi:hypothetical protein
MFPFGVRSRHSAASLPDIQAQQTGFWITDAGGRGATRTRTLNRWLTPEGPDGVAALLRLRRCRCWRPQEASTGEKIRELLRFEHLGAAVGVVVDEQSWAAPRCARRGRVGVERGPARPYRTSAVARERCMHERHRRASRILRLWASPGHVDRATGGRHAHISQRKARARPRLAQTYPARWRPRQYRRTRPRPAPRRPHETPLRRWRPHETTADPPTDR